MGRQNIPCLDPKNKEQTCSTNLYLVLQVVILGLYVAV